MVKTSTDVMDTNPLERMEKLSDITEEKKNTLSSKKKEYEELERKKKKEIEELEQKQKKDIEDLSNKKKKELSELETKKKELEELEKKKVKEIEETEDLIEQSFQDLMRHKRMIMAQDESDLKSKNLEDMTQGATRNNLKNTNYTNFFENLNAPTHLYDVANKSFYNGLTELRDRASRGEITPQEEEFVERLRETFDRFSENRDYVRNNDQNEYVTRSIKVINQIAQYSSRNL